MCPDKQLSGPVTDPASRMNIAPLNSKPQQKSQLPKSMQITFLPWAQWRFHPKDLQSFCTGRGSLVFSWWEHQAAAAGQPSTGCSTAPGIQLELNCNSTSKGEGKYHHQEGARHIQPFKISLSFLVKLTVSEVGMKYKKYPNTGLWTTYRSTYKWEI